MTENENAMAELVGHGAIGQFTSAEVDAQIATAKRYPRDLAKFEKNVDAQVTTDIETAISMTYHLEREDKKTKEKKEIIGPSVRFAEIILLAWGNMRVGATPIDIDHQFVTARGFAWDLESNVAQFRDRKAGITTSTGHRYGQDMIQTRANGAASTAYREAILKTIPQAFWKKHWQKAMDYVADASGEKLAAARDKAIKYFLSKGATIEMVLAKLGKEKVEDIDGQDMVVLGAIYTSMRDENKTAKEMFEGAKDEAANATAATAAGLVNEVKEKAKENATPGTEKPTPPADSTLAEGSDVRKPIK